MSRESSLRNYLKTLRDHWKQLDVALNDDIRYSKLSEKQKQQERKLGWPPEGKTEVLLRGWGNSDTLHTLFGKSSAEAALAGATIFDLVLPRLKSLQARHEELLTVAWYHWEQAVYYAKSDPRMQPTMNAAEEAWRELDQLLLAVEQKLEDKIGHAKPPMSVHQKAVYDLLLKLPFGEGRRGTQILFELKTLGIEQSTLTTRIIPFLKTHYNVKNTPGAGYFIQRPE